MSEIKKREEIDNQFKWDLTTIFKTEKEFLNSIEEVKELIQKFKSYQNHVMDNGKTLYHVLKDELEILRRVDKIYCYANHKSDEDVSNNHNQELVGKSLLLYEEATKEMYFIEPEMLKEDYSKVEEFYKEEKNLLEYEKLIKDIFRYKEHTLSDSEEKLLSSLTKGLGQDSTTYSYLTDSDLKFGTILDENKKEVELTDTNYSIFIRSKDRTVRENAFKKLYEVYKQFKNTLASTLDGHIKQNVTLSHIKKYDSAFSKALYKDELEEKVYDTLVDTVHKNLNIYQKYFNLKKEILKLKEMHLYDVYVELVDDYEKEYSFDDAKELIFKALKPLGEEYLNDLEKAFKEKWIDIYPNQNKRGGAYSGGSYDTNPFVLLNYQGKIDDVSTIIHELGHSMHSYYTRHNQSVQYGDYPIFVAEVASTTNEILLSRYLIENSNDPKEKLLAINHLLELFKATIYRQVMFEEFEKYAYDLIEKDDVITSDKLCQKYLELNEEYFGKDIVVDEEISYEWEKVPHFYYNFYVFKYATSLCAASEIATKILKGDKEARDNYIKMLKSGSTKSPLDTLKIAGVDMTKKEVVESAIKMFDETIEEFKKCYQEMKRGE